MRERENAFVISKSNAKEEAHFSIRSRALDHIIFALHSSVNEKIAQKARGFLRLGAKRSFVSRQMILMSTGADGWG